MGKIAIIVILLGAIYFIFTPKKNSNSEEET